MDDEGHETTGRRRKTERGNSRSSDGLGERRDRGHLTESTEAGEKGGAVTAPEVEGKQPIRIDDDFWALVRAALEYPLPVLLEAVRVQGYLMEQRWTACGVCRQPFSATRHLVGWGPGWQPLCGECF